MKDEEQEEVKIFTSALAIILFMCLMCSVFMSCSNIETALEIPQHIQQRILETENTYMIDVKYLVWNDMLEGYEWEYYSDYNIGADYND